MYITITTNAGTQTAEVANTESGLYEEIGKHLLDLSIPNRMTVTTPVGDAEYDITQRGNVRKRWKDSSKYVCKGNAEYYQCFQPILIRKLTLPVLTRLPITTSFTILFHRADLLHATYGRIGSERGEMFGVKDLQNPYPIHMYWIRYYEKLSKGYVDSSDIYLAPQYTTKQEVKTKDSDVDRIALYEKLYRYAKGMVETHLVNQNVTVAQVKESKRS
ncbi:MAG: hypothetical protein ACLTX3_08995 [Lachnospiraceae bacterium]